VGVRVYDSSRTFEDWRTRSVFERENVRHDWFIRVDYIFLVLRGDVYILRDGVALLGIGAHSAARVPDDLFIDDASESNGFFSFMMPPRPGQPSGTI